MKNFRPLPIGKLKDGLLFRGPHLHNLSLKDKKLLFNKLGIKTVIDLRTSQERNDKPDINVKGVKNFHISLIDMEEMGASSEKEGKRRVLKEHKLPDIFDYYRLLVSPKRKDAYTKLFDVLINEEGPFYIHCTVGKDRTGITSALILNLLGESKETIYSDFLKTNDDKIIPFSYRIFALFLDKEFRKEFMEYFKAKTEFLDKAFDVISEEYGSIDNFYEEICGLDKTKRITFIKKFKDE